MRETDCRHTGAKTGDASGSFTEPLRNYRKPQLTKRSQLICNRPKYEQ